MTGLLAGQRWLWHIPLPQGYRRRSSGVERALGKGEASGSIPLGGTILQIMKKEELVMNGDVLWVQYYPYQERR